MPLTVSTAPQCCGHPMEARADALAYFCLRCQRKVSLQETLSKSKGDDEYTLEAQRRKVDEERRTRNLFMGGPSGFAGIFGAPPPPPSHLFDALRYQFAGLPSLLSDRYVAMMREGMERWAPPLPEPPTLEWGPDGKAVKVEPKPDGKVLKFEKVRKAYGT